MAAHGSGPAGELKLVVESSPAEVVVHCSGKITASTASAFLNQVRPLVSQAGRIVLDLAEVGYIDSSGLGAIARMWSTAQKSSCAFKLANVAPRIKDLLAMTNLSSIFDA
ncbi:MAG TPA: STAS domain-containing protein [Candidatus Solibacter sp.]|nr:STAS domain-containing protein [Candidatus Solibacter sp.]